jgi:FkbM family methyltransferase
MLNQLFSIVRFIRRHPLTQGHQLKAIADFARWQIASRLLGRKVVIPWVDGTRLLTGPGETGLTGNLYCGLMEYEDMLFLLHALDPEETFVDIGANAGAYTILASGVVRSHSIAFEPLPDTVDRLVDQIQLNRINDLVSVINMGLSDHAGELSFTSNSDTMNKVTFNDADGHAIRVRVSTLDSELDTAKRYFFKIDVEGFEYQVLQGGLGIIGSDQTSALIIELNGSGEEFGHSNEDVHRALLALQFHPVSYDPRTRTLKKMDGYNRIGGNTIYVKDFELMSNRCKSAPKRCIHTANQVCI